MWGDRLHQRTLYVRLVNQSVHGPLDDRPLALARGPPVERKLVHLLDGVEPGGGTPLGGGAELVSVQKLAADLLADGPAVFCNEGEISG
ncbi:MAG TPA: hypothetical protein VGK73_35075, partial [Polyangiaceae bacterium]